jgi:hypothetical protein
MDHDDVFVAGIVRMAQTGYATEGRGMIVAITDEPFYVPMTRFDSFRDQVLRSLDATELAEDIWQMIEQYEPSTSYVALISTSDTDDEGVISILPVVLNIGGAALAA